MNIAKLSEVWRDCIAPPSASLLAWRVWERNFKVFAKYWPGAILVYFADPIFYLIIFGMGLGGRIDALIGYRYLRLHDTISIQSNLITAVPAGAAPAGTAHAGIRGSGGILIRRPGSNKNQ